jgi:hypothetical protein
VQLPDRRSDFVDLLKALYNPLCVAPVHSQSIFADDSRRHFDTLPPESKLDPTLDFTEGILHLSKKYFITGLQTKCLSLITALRLCPTTPFQANFMYDRMGALTPEGCISDAVTVTSLIRLIHVALDLDATDVFKLSFPYYIVATRIKPDLLLVPAAVGLSCEGKLLCMVAREKLRLAWKDCYAFLHQFRPSKDCLTRSECSSAKGVLSEWSRIKNSVRLDPLQPYSGWKTLGVCRSCLHHAMLRHELTRLQLWSRLPSLFNLPEWSDDT